jgi:hypothetical protein
VLALVLTLILAVYILGPDLFSRWVVGLVVPGRIRNRNRSEEISKALFGSMIPFALAYLFVHFKLHHLSNFDVLKSFFTGIYSDRSFERNPDLFFASLVPVIRANGLLVLVIYGLEFCWAVFLIFLIMQCGRILRRLEGFPRIQGAVINLIRPWTAEWHLKLSGILLPRKADYTQADVLTKLDILYRGTLTDFDLAPDGMLVSITMEDVKKFRRLEFLEARSEKRSGKVNSALFWTPIGGRVFVLMASEIISLNLNYIDPNAAPPTSAVTKSTANQVLSRVKADRAAQARPTPRKQ